VSRHEFVTVYDISTAGFQFLAPCLIGVALILISVVLFVARDSPVVRSGYKFRPFPQWPTLFPLVFGGIALVFTTLLFAPAISQYVFLRAAESQRQYYEVVGQVEEFHPWVSHERPESFRVDGVQFTIFGAEIGPGFKDTDYPIRNGVCLRLWYVGSAIIRVEKRDGALGATCAKQNAPHQ